MSPPGLGIKNTAADPLKGLVNLNVVLPCGRDILMTFRKSLPMMDLLVQIATTHKISPGSHVIHVTGMNGTVPYKPSTPVGELGKCTLNIVPKNQISSANAQKLKLVNAPFEQTFRLQVFLPRNQLYVTRISPKIKLADILTHVCLEKNLDPSKYSIRHPNNLGEVLDTNLCLVDYKLTQVALVSNPSRSVSMSSINVAQLKSPDRQINYNRTQSLNSSAQNVSETNRSEKSSQPTPVVIPTRPPKKRRPAPKPPQTSNQKVAPAQVDVSGDSDATVISHSRNSSDSSGYHETSVLGESPDIDYCFSESLSCQNKLNGCPEMSQYQTMPNLSRSLSNLTAVGSNLNKAPSIISHSVSTTCLPSAARRKKKAPSPPPKFLLKSTINEETSSSCSRPETESISSLCASSIPSDSEPSTPLGERSASQSCLNVVDVHEAKAATLPANTKLPEVECVPQVAEGSSSMGNVAGSSFEEEKEERDCFSKASNLSDSSQSEMKMNDEEIDRIFNSATHGHESSTNTPPSSLGPSPKNDHLKERLSSPIDDQDTKPNMNNSESSSSGDGTPHNDMTHDENSDLGSQKYEANTQKQQMKTSEVLCVSGRVDDDSVRESSCSFSLAMPKSLSDVSSENSGTPSGFVVEESKASTKDNLSVNPIAPTNVGNVEKTSPTINGRGNSAVDPKGTAGSTAQRKNSGSKSPVIEELKATITDQNFQAKKFQPFKQPELKRSNSVLDNFKISAYHTIKKPIHILSDSLESSSFNDPYKESNVKKSMSIIYDQSAIFGRPLKPVQRSTSHVSLSTIGASDLAFKSNLPTFKNLKSKVVSNGNLAASNENILKYCSASNLRKISSEISLNEENCSTSWGAWKNRSPFKNPSGIEADSGLQSLQVMKTILPKLHRSCSNLSENRESESDLQEPITRESESNTFKVPYPVPKVTKLSSPKFVDPPPSRLRSYGDSRKNLFSGSSDKEPICEVDETSRKEEIEETNRISRIPTVKSVELKKNVSRFSMPSVVPDYNLVSLASYNRFDRPKNVNRYSSSNERVNGTGLSEIKEQPRPVYPYERSFSKENSTFSENHLKNSQKSNQLRSVILDERKAAVRDSRLSSGGAVDKIADAKRDFEKRDSNISKKFVGVPSPPPAFVMPKLKPASRREINVPKRDINPKDVLLDSIRSFGGIANLKKTGNVV
nr:PREDICTED: PHD finger protein rhinoceros-like [Bemisia tabaci]XP_018907846.1 PREDICTED: PHD finger protein rhinoceros-like [Bemisia tabaci]